MLSTGSKIEQEIKKHKEGAIIFTEDFHDLGSPGAIKVALHRLTKKGLISNLARGIYAKPTYSKLLNKDVLPSLEEIAVAIAKRDKARILPTGVYARNMLVLSTQVPLKLVYLTDGSPRKINIGNRIIQFKKTTPKNLSLKGELSKLVIQALKEIGKDNVTQLELKKIEKLLQKEHKEDLKHDIALAPQWISEILSKSL